MKGKGETTNGPAKTPRRSVRIAANFIVLVLCLLAVEAGFTFYYFLSEGKLVSPQTREEARTNQGCLVLNKSNAFLGLR